MPETTRPDLPANLRPLFEALKSDGDEREERSKQREAERESAREERARERHRLLVEEIGKLQATDREMRSDIEELKFRADRHDRLAFPQRVLWMIAWGLWLLGLGALALQVYALIHPVR